ncbi:MAG: type II secretion system minor pseudopilin GspJ [Gammaproteobacteria bacterium]
MKVEVLKQAVLKQGEKIIKRSYFDRVSGRLLDGGLAGFTLIELLVAVSISAVVSVVLYTFFGYVLTAKEGADLFSSDLARLQRALIIMQRDVDQAVQRSVRDSFGDTEEALVLEGGEGFSLTHVGWTMPPFPRGIRSEVQRVRYHLVDQNLIRTHWLTPDVTADTTERNPVETTLLENIESFEVRVAQPDLNGSPSWYSEWPPLDQQAVDVQGNPLKSDPLPTWLEVQFEHPRFGALRRIFRLVDNGADPKTLPAPQAAPGAPGAPNAAAPGQGDLSNAQDGGNQTNEGADANNNDRETNSDESTEQIIEADDEGGAQ